MKYCPECGEQLQETHKFCPSCGSKIIRGTDQKNKEFPKHELKSEKQEVIVCQNCGEENSPDDIACSGCGIKLSKGKRISVKRSPGPTINRMKETSPGTTAVDKENHIDKARIIFVGAGILAILLLVLYTSGIFDTIPVEGSGVNLTQSPSSGINLTNLQRINQIEEQLKNDPENMQLLLDLAHLKNDSGLYERAIADYRKYLEVHPEDADARIDMGVCYYNLKQYESAMVEMKTAIEYSPNHQIGHLNLGIVNLAAGNIEDSKEWLRKAVSLNPESEIGRKAQELLQSH